MEMTIRICDRCGKQIDKDNKQHIVSISGCYCFEVCNECYEVMKPIKEKRDKDYERLVNKLNKIEADFNSEFKAFLGEDK